MSNQPGHEKVAFYDSSGFEQTAIEFEKST